MGSISDGFGSSRFTHQIQSLLLPEDHSCSSTAAFVAGGEGGPQSPLRRCRRPTTRLTTRPSAAQYPSPRRILRMAQRFPLELSTPSALNLDATALSRLDEL